MNRREFITIFSGALAALHLPFKAVVDEVEPAPPPQTTPEAVEIEDGLHVIPNTQPYDADYLQYTLIWFKDHRLYARNVVRFTGTVLRDKEKFQLISQAHLKEAIASFKSQVDIYLAHNVPHPPRISFE